MNRHIEPPHWTGLTAGQLTFTTALSASVPNLFYRWEHSREIKYLAQGHTVYKVVKQNFQF